MRLTLAVLVLVAALVAACATNPVTGKKEFSLMSEAEELAIGQQADAEIRREMGVYPDQELQRYVSDIGMRLAQQSHRPNLPWTFTVVDSPAINAFAVPGGYVYITRGILPYLKDESELAGVLGHEIGHVTARHASQQYSRQAGGSIGLMVLSIFVPQTAPFADLSSMGLGMLFLKYGRDDELESDRLGHGVRLGERVGPVGGAALPLDAGARGCDERAWRAELAVHASRSGLPRRRWPSRCVAKYASDVGDRSATRTTSLRAIDGVVVGDSLEQGIVRGNAFVHPMMRIALEFPEGWEVANTRRAGDGARARDEALHAAADGGAAARARASTRWRVDAMRRAGYTLVDGCARQRWAGSMPTSASTADRSAAWARCMMRAAHVAMGRQVYVFAGFAPEAEFDQVRPQIEPSLQDVPRAERAGGRAGAAQPSVATTPSGRATRGSRSHSGRARASPTPRRWRS